MSIKKRITKSFIFLLISFISFILIVVTPVNAEFNSIFDIFEQRYVTNINQLPHSDGTPDKNWQTVKHIRAWIDIVGFDKMSEEDGIYYVPGSPEKYAIVQAEAEGYFPKGQKCTSCTVDSIKKDITVSKSGIYTLATLTVTLFWHETLCSQNSCQQVYYTEKATFTDSEISPQVYVPLKNMIINITEYNNTISPQIGILIYPPKGTMYTAIKYQDNIALRFFKIGESNKTKKGIYYAHLIPYSKLEVRGNNISKLNKYILIKTNLTTFNYDDLSITASSLYETVYTNKSNYNINRENYNPIIIITNPLIWAFLGFLTVIIYPLHYMLRKMIRI